MLFSRSLDETSNLRSSLAISVFAVLLIHGSSGKDIYRSDENLTMDLDRINVNPKSTMPIMSTTSVGVTVATSTSTMLSIDEKPEIKCPENMQLEQEIGTEPFCECEAGYLYYRKLDSCYKQYTRGPCTEGKHFVLRPKASKARCVRNPCPVANTVMYKGACHELFNSGEPCEPEEVLVVADNWNEPGCISIHIMHDEMIKGPVIRCPRGTRKAGQGICRIIILPEEQIAL